MAAARFPAKAPARTAAAEAQSRPGFPGRGEMSRQNARVSAQEDVSVRLVVRIQRAQKREGDVAKVDLREECGVRRERGTSEGGRA